MNSNLARECKKRNELRDYEPVSSLMVCSQLDMVFCVIVIRSHVAVSWLKTTPTNQA